MSPTSADACRVLCVDDEANVLAGLRRTLHGRYDIEMTSSPVAAREQVTADPDRFGVVMSDLRMPGTDGISLLSEIRDLAPNSVRVLLTGHGDLRSAMDAVNRGSVFRFLCKPASREELLGALDAAAHQHRLLVAEKELLEQTLRGSVAALLDTLSLASPAAFARTDRVKRTVAALAKQRNLTGWELEVAAMLSQIGSVTIGPEIVAKMEKGQPLNREEQHTVDAMPEISERLLAKIPRLENVRRIIRYQDKRYDGSGPPDDRISGDDLPEGSRILKVALDLDAVESQGKSRVLAIEALQNRKGRYDPALLEDLHCLYLGPSEVRDIDPLLVQPGMIIEADVRDTGGLLLLTRGREVTENLVNVIHAYGTRGRIPGRISVSGP